MCGRVSPIPAPATHVSDNHTAHPRGVPISAVIAILWLVFVSCVIPRCVGGYALLWEAWRNCGICVWMGVGGLLIMFAISTMAVCSPYAEDPVLSWSGRLIVLCLYASVVVGVLILIGVEERMSLFNLGMY